MPRGTSPQAQRIKKQYRCLSELDRLMLGNAS